MRWLARWLAARAGLGGAGGGKKATTADAACVDDNANVTVYAAINLDGADLVRLLKHQNYGVARRERTCALMTRLSPLPF